MEYYSALKYEEILPFETTWLDLEGIMLNELRERQILYDLVYMWNLKKVPNSQKKRSDLWLLEVEGRVRRRNGKEVIKRCRLPV